MLVVVTPYRDYDDSRSIRRSSLLARTVASVERQKVPILHVIVDDGSPVLAFNQIRRTYESRHRIVVRREKPEREVASCCGALNFGFDFVLGGNLAQYGVTESAFVTALHSDDLLIDSHLRMAPAASSAFIYSDAGLLVEPEGNLWRWTSMCGSPRSVRRSLWVRAGMPYPTMTWRVEFLRHIRDYAVRTYGQSGVMDNRIGCGEDVDVALSSLECLIDLRYTATRVPSVTAIYRIRPDSLAATRPTDQRTQEERFVLRKHFGAAALLQRIARFAIRPECTFPALMPLRVRHKRALVFDDDENSGIRVE